MVVMAYTTVQTSISSRKFPISSLALEIIINLDFLSCSFSFCSFISFSIAVSLRLIVISSSYLLLWD